MAHYFGLLPQVETMVPFDFRILDSQVIFPERTPGRLKMSIFGKPVRLCDIGQIRLQTAPGFEAFHFAADECFFTDTFPDCSLQKKQLIDELGQWTQKDWEGKLSGREECTRRLRALLEEAETSGDHFPFQTGTNSAAGRERPSKRRDGSIRKGKTEDSGW